MIKNNKVDSSNKNMILEMIYEGREEIK